jgi:signal recognition particle subunit SEC65
MCTEKQYRSTNLGIYICEQFYQIHDNWLVSYSTARTDTAFCPFRRYLATSTLFPRHPLHSTAAMSHHAQIEEVSDSDPEEVAPSFDSDDELPRNAIISPANIPTKAAPAPSPQQMPMPSMPAPEPQREIPRHFQCLYPVYFDKTRSRAEGRKVGAELAVENPLARDIVDAVQMLGLNAGLEPEKLHPKDWANPGRVRVQLKNENGQLVNSKIKNSTWLDLQNECLNVIWT